MLAILLTAVVGVPLLGALGLSAGAVRNLDQQLVFYTVKRADLPITVVERGNLDSQDEVAVFCELENLSRNSKGASGTQILYIVPNGQSVKEGDLLVEFDSAALQDRLDDQGLALERARAAKLQADARCENQITRNKTALANAQLKVELATINLESFGDEDGGTFQLALQDVEMRIQEAQAKKLIQDAELEGVQELCELGYRSQGDLAQAKFSAMAAGRELSKRLSERKKLVAYDKKKQLITLAGAVETAKRNLLQVQRDAESDLAQAVASRNAADRALAKEQEKFDRYTEQLEKCKIRSPRDGMVAYAVPDGRSRYRSSARLIAAGAFVRQRQKILTLPSLTKMEVKVAVHESALDKVTVGLPATVRLDAFRDRAYRGTVTSVAVMPDPGNWLSADAKVYSTVVSIDEEVEGLRPGMTATVEIHVDRLNDVLSVPVQAIVQVEDATWCYVDSGGEAARRPLKLGETNDKFVEIVQGLGEGERVVLNPMAIMDELGEGSMRRPP